MRTSGSLIPSAWPWTHAMNSIQSSPSLRAKSGWRTYHRLRRPFLEIPGVELEADYRSYGSPAIAHKRAEHSAHKPIDRINLRLVHHVLYCATYGSTKLHAQF